MAGLVPFNHRKNELATPTLWSMMDDFFNDFDFRPLGRGLLFDSFKVDVRESDSAYTVEAEMPGVHKEDITLSLDDNRLTIGVTRDEETDEGDDHFIHKERRSSSMQRSLVLADAAGDNIDASLTDGVLKIVVPKKSHPETTKQIEIK